MNCSLRIMLLENPPLWSLLLHFRKKSDQTWIQLCVPGNSLKIRFFLCTVAIQVHNDALAGSGNNPTTLNYCMYQFIHVHFFFYSIVSISCDVVIAGIPIICYCFHHPSSIELSCSFVVCIISLHPLTIFSMKET